MWLIHTGVCFLSKLCLNYFYMIFSLHYVIHVDNLQLTLFFVFFCTLDDNMCLYFQYLLPRTSYRSGFNRTCTTCYLSTSQPRLQLTRRKISSCPSSISAAKGSTVRHWGRKWYNLFIMFIFELSFLSWGQIGPWRGEMHHLSSKRMLYLIRLSLWMM